MTRNAADAFGRLEAELHQERGAALARIGRTLEELIERLTRIRSLLPGCPAAEQERWRAEYARLHERAHRWRWYLEVQREALGLRRHECLEEAYRVPPPLDR